jgi:hypothetical protein
MDTPPATGGKHHHQANIHLASKETQGLTGASAPALGTAEAEPEGKRLPMILWNATGLSGVVRTMQYTPAKGTTLIQGLLCQCGIKLLQA